jgi:hypothetical protein
MNHQVQVFEIGRDMKAEDRPRAVSGFAVTADTADEARHLAVARLKGDGRTVRSISFLAAGGLAAVVTDSAPESAVGKAQRTGSGR